MTETQFEAPERVIEPGLARPGSEANAVMRQLLRSWWIIVLCGIIALAVGLGVDSRAAKTYQASTYVLLNPNNFQQAVSGGYNPTTSATQIATAVALLTPQRQAIAAEQAGLRGGDAYSVTVNSGATSNVVTVVGSTSNPRKAAALADAAAEQMISVAKLSNTSALQAARATVRQQLAGAKRSDKRPLASELNSFATLEALDNQSLQIIERATIPGVPSGTSKTRVGALALVLGLLLGAGIGLLRRNRKNPYPA